jgi:argininosuccinate lyase
MTFNAPHAQAAADDQFLVAIDIAEKLVLTGVPFRQAHEQVGKLVGEAVRDSKSLKDVVASTPEFAQYVDLFAQGAALKNRTSLGAAGPAAKSEQETRLTSAFSAAKARVGL